MDRNIVRAYLWQEVINLGFNPSGDADQKSWVLQYARSLKEFWEIDAYPINLRVESGVLKGRVDSPANLSFDFDIAAKDKFLVQFLSAPIRKRGNGLMWNHDVDSAFFNFPIQPLLTFLPKQRNIALKSNLQESDIEVIVDGLLCHTRAHQHIELPIDNHEIRIGGGIDNAFLFLFHLRYQLCPIPEKRKKEKQRLVQLFLNAIKNKNKKNVPINTLMAQPW